MIERQSDKLQAVLDYYFGLGYAASRAKTAELLANDAEAQRLREGVIRMLSPLEQLKQVEAPQGLTARTLAFIEEYDAERAERAATVKRTGETKFRDRHTWFLASFSDFIAAAASIMLIMVFLPQGLDYARQRSQKVACANQLGDVGRAFSQYANDNAGYLPFVSCEAGQRWCDVGKPGSNTRNIFLLVNNGYIPIRSFECPAVPMSEQIFVHYDGAARQTRIDFARRRDISYSSRQMTKQNLAQLSQDPEELLITDQNPLFMDFEYRRELDLHYTPELMAVNSPNHRGTGQNGLRADAAVQFMKNRRTGIAQDDIFTIQSVMRYNGYETPQSTADVFIP